jgi:hypothetical protein
MSGRTDLPKSHYLVGFSESILLLATQVVLVGGARWLQQFVNREGAGASTYL